MISTLIRFLLIPQRSLAFFWKTSSREKWGPGLAFNKNVPCSGLPASGEIVLSTDLICVGPHSILGSHAVCSELPKANVQSRACHAEHARERERERKLGSAGSYTTRRIDGRPVYYRDIKSEGKKSCVGVYSSRSELPLSIIPLCGCGPPSVTK